MNSPRSAGDRRGLRVVEHQVERDQVGRRRAPRAALRAQLLRDQLREPRRALEPGDRHELRLRVELEALALDLAVQVDRQARDAQQRAREIDEQRAHAVVLAQRHAARRARGRDRARCGAARRRTARPRAGGSRARRRRRSGLSRRFGESVCAPTTRKPASTGDSRPTWNATRLPPPRTHVAALAGRELPGVDVARLAEARRLEPAHGLGDGVVRRGRAIDEAEQIGDGVLHRDAT